MENGLLLSNKFNTREKMVLIILHEYACQEFSIKELYGFFSEGRDTVKTAIRNLKKLGLIESKIERDSNNNKITKNYTEIVWDALDAYLK